MNENLDLTELLKDCPKGTKFYSSTFGNVEFLRIEKDDFINPIVIKWFKEEGNSYIEYLTKEGTFRGLGECTLFPSKDQRDWSKWQRPFEDGDILSYQNKFYNNRTIYIYKYHRKMNTSYYVALSGSSDSDFMINNKYGCALDNYNDTARFATEEEKLKLFQAIKDNGYKWNEETKTLEKLVDPKFKVGDRIKHRLTGDVYKVVFILSNECGGGLYNVLTTNEIGKIIDIEEQDNYELIPDKFNPKFFKPFDKALVRIDSDDNWYAVFFSHIEDINGEKFVTTAGMCYKQMIPYNDDTKHLLGTNNEAPEYYRYWED